LIKIIEKDNIKEKNGFEILTCCLAIEYKNRNKSFNFIKTSKHWRIIMKPEPMTKPM